ncbi:hypothetical protein OG976_00290 [Mycobacterium sp. NBC_00419]|uniref:hypothetical protein n=1 Tax=Mycobacterium sp. NBC_00419 TaxID=2975989 RepID=UPI002E223942
MSHPIRRRAALVLTPVIAASMVLAPVAAAEPAPPAPPPGSGPADLIIGEIEALGYNVAINWVNGQDSTPQLARCRVVAFHNPDRSGGPAQAGTTVYVDVLCPDESED